MSFRWRSSSTSETGRAPATALALFLAFAATVVGCTAFDALVGSGSKPAAAPSPTAAAPVVAAKPAAPARVAFDHQFHLGRGPTCLDCHEGADKNDKADMPKLEFCMDCHTDIDEKKPKERTVGAFLDKPGGTPQWSRVTAQGPDVVFSHKAHAAKKIECAECHKGIAEAKAVTKDLFVDMDACVKCHDAKGAKSDCAMCHKAAAKSVAEGKGPFWQPANHENAWRKEHGKVATAAGPKTRAERCDDCHGKAGFPESGSCAVCHASTRPADHELLWKTLHGQAVRRDPASVQGRCGFCHGSSVFPAQSRCVVCHLTEPPRDHSQSWRVGGGHGLSASMDRTRCDACHTPDACVACHSTNAPRSHRGGWGAPRDAHCVNCHLPLTKEAPGACGVCHQGTPSHARAPRMPSEPPHRPDMQCAICHTPSRLKHATNETNCLVCHR